jgi:methylglyoxal synthase
MRPAATLGLLAHDAKREQLCVFAAARRHLLDYLRLIAPSDTARALADVGVETVALAPETHGGDLQLGAAVVDGMVDAIIFLNDPQSALPAEPDMRPILKICDLEGIPIATNLAAAEIVLLHLAENYGEGPGSRLKGHVPEPHPAGTKRVRTLRLVPFPGSDAHG